MNDTLFQAAALILPLVFAIFFHEVAHGWTARLLGDPTAHEMRRLSLNPLRHVDPIGTVVLPGLLALIKAPIVGWAKPVPVDKWRLRNPRTGMMAVAAAGPAANLVMAAISAVALGLLSQGIGEDPVRGGLVHFAVLNCFNFIQVNIFLALFNLLPIPPFDGSHIVEGVLPQAAARRYAALRGIGLPLIIGLLIVLPWLVPAIDIVRAVVVPPVEWLTHQYLSLADAVAKAVQG